MAQRSSDLSAVSSLGDPVRARLYQVVSRGAAPVGRDEAAAEAGIGRPLAAYHLDKLVEIGLLTASYQRPAGRSGPGAGRPAKVYSRAEREFTASVPPREYELAARLLAVAVEADSGGASRAALYDAARQFGTNLGLRWQSGDAGQTDARYLVRGALSEHGYEPWQDEDGGLRLRNCPFHKLAAQHRDLVCGMNLALIDGLVTALRASELHPCLDPGKGRCCVVIGTDQQLSAPRGQERHD